MGILAGILGGISGAAKAGVETIDKNEKERIAKEAADLSYKREMAMEAFRNNNATKLQNDRITADKDAAELDRTFRAGESKLGRDHDVTMEQKRSENNMANTILSGNQQTARDNLNRQANREDNKQQHDWKMAEQRDAAERNLANSITEFNMKIAAGKLTKDTKTSVEAWSKELSSLIESDPTNPRIKMLQSNIDSALGVTASESNKVPLSEKLGLGTEDDKATVPPDRPKVDAGSRLEEVISANENAALNKNVVSGYNKDLDMAERDLSGLIGVKPFTGGLMATASPEQGRLSYHLKRLENIINDDKSSPEQKHRAEAVLAELEQGLRK